jgi:hypothetical protein
MEYVKEYYNENGEPTIEESKACAKTLKNTQTDSVRHFVKVFGSGLYNPVDFESKRRSIIKSKFIKTSELTFLLYLRFLRTKSKASLFQAQRGLRG